MYDSFVKILTFHLTEKKWKKHYQKIIFNLIAVDEGYKPSILWDIGPAVDSQVLDGLIKNLKDESLLKYSTNLLLFKNEIFITNLETLVEYLGDRASSIIFVDCSSTIDEPAVVASDSEVYKIIVNNIQLIKETVFLLLEKAKKNVDSYDEVIELTVEARDQKLLCPVTIFGILLGYPVVYWSKNILNGNCLSFIQLCVFEVKVNAFSPKLTRNDNYLHCLYSFSVPHVLNLDSFVDSWFTILKALHVAKFQLCKKIISLPCIQL